MAKDGTNRGGARPGAGRKKKALSEKIQDGQKATVLDFRDMDLPAMPEVKEFMKAEQRMGELHAEEVYKETWEWLRDRGCAKVVNNQLLVSYVMAISRWVQLEELISDWGFMVQKQTTAGKVAAPSPIVQMAQNYLKQANLLWVQIFTLVKENCSTDFEGNPHDDMMERILTGR